VNPAFQDGQPGLTLFRIPSVQLRGVVFTPQPASLALGFNHGEGSIQVRPCLISVSSPPFAHAFEQGERCNVIPDQEAHGASEPLARDIFQRLDSCVGVSMQEGRVPILTGGLVGEGLDNLLMCFDIGVCLKRNKGQMGTSAARRLDEDRMRAPVEKLWLDEDVSQFDFYDRPDVVTAAADAVAELFKRSS